MFGNVLCITIIEWLKSVYLKILNILVKRVLAHFVYIMPAREAENLFAGVSLQPGLVGNKRGKFPLFYGKLQFGN